MIVCDIAMHCSNQKMQRDLTFDGMTSQFQNFFEACFRPYFTQLLCKKTAKKALALIALSAATDCTVWENEGGVCCVVFTALLQQERRHRPISCLARSYRGYLPFQKEAKWKGQQQRFKMRSL